MNLEALTYFAITALIFIIVFCSFAGAFSLSSAYIKGVLLNAIR